MRVTTTIGLLLLLYVPVGAALLAWFIGGCYLRHLWYIWAVYSVFLIITNAVVFGRLENQLSGDLDWGPHVLEMTLSIAPLLLFLLLNVASDSGSERRLIILISFRLTLDLFDAIDMLAANPGQSRQTPRWDSTRISNRCLLFGHCSALAVGLRAPGPNLEGQWEYLSVLVLYSHSRPHPDERSVFNSAIDSLGQIQSPDSPVLGYKSGIYTMVYIIECGEYLPLLNGLNHHPIIIHWMMDMSVRTKSAVKVTLETITEI